MLEVGDVIGTVRREEHDGGFSIWVRVGRSVIDFTVSRTPYLTTQWTCICSTAIGNVGATLPDEVVEESTTVIGAVPGTPAAFQAGE